MIIIIIIIIIVLIGAFISIFPNRLKAPQGFKALKPAANGRYLTDVQIIALLFPFTVQKYIYPAPVRKLCMLGLFVRH